MLSACSGVFCLVLPSLPLAHSECKDPATSSVGGQTSGKGLCVRAGITALSTSVTAPYHLSLLVEVLDQIPMLNLKLAPLLLCAHFFFFCTLIPSFWVVYFNPRLSRGKNKTRNCVVT